MLGVLFSVWLLLPPSYDFGKGRTSTTKLLNAAIMLSMLISVALALSSFHGLGKTSALMQLVVLVQLLVTGAFVVPVWWCCQLYRVRASTLLLQHSCLCCAAVVIVEIVVLCVTAAATLTRL